MTSHNTRDFQDELELVHSILNQSSIVGFVWKNEPKWPVLFVTENVSKIFGHTSDDFISGKVAYEQVVHPDDLARVMSEVVEAGNDPNCVEFEHLPYRVLTKSGKIRWVSDRTTIDRSVDREIRCYMGVIQDISEKIERDRVMQEREERYRSLFQYSQDGIFIHDLEGNIFDVNHKTIELFGYTKNEMHSMHISNLHPKSEMQKSKDAFEKIMAQGFVNFEILFRRKDGTTFTADVTSSLFNLGNEKVIHGIVRDISEKIHDREERRKLESKLIHAQKMEALGTLAGGIAHDFNNLLMGIQGRASLMEVDVAHEHPFKRHLESIQEHIKSATGLTKQLLGLARGGKYEVKATDLNQLIRSSSEMFGRTRKEVEITLQLEEPSPSIHADRGQIDQILLNIFVNAWQAMDGGGKLFIKTGCLTLDKEFCEPHHVRPGEYVRISIIDTGPGIEAENLSKVFDPFFSTKEKSRGTGLGLASAYGIVKNHNGIISVYSEPGHGATFNIYLPISPDAATQETPTEKALATGEECILLVDDEEYILDVAASMLERLGYQAVLAVGGENALDVIADRKDEIDLVILDLIMPGIDGGRTFDLIREIAPEMKVLLSSGYAINGQADTVLRKGCRGFIQKPFHIHELSQKIRAVLDQS